MKIKTILLLALLSYALFMIYVMFMSTPLILKIAVVVTFITAVVIAAKRRGPHFTLRVSADAGATYKIEGRSRNLADFSAQVDRLDSDGIYRWTITDAEGNTVQRCMMHRQMLAMLADCK